MAELRGPNENFVSKFLKNGGDVKVGSMKETKLESVNHDDMNGNKKLADTNPGAGEQNHEVHGENPAEKHKLTGIEIPKLSDGAVSKGEKLNRPPRAFSFGREGHKE